MSEHFLVSLRCLVWLLHHPSAVRSKNQNFSLETLLSEVMRSYFVVPSRADTGVHVCILAMCNESCPRSRALGVIFFFLSKQRNRMRKNCNHYACYFSFVSRGCVQFLRKMECVLAHVVMITSLSVAYPIFKDWCVHFDAICLYQLFFFFFFFSFLKCTMSGQLWNMRELSR